MGLDISKIVNAELKKLAFLKDENNNGKLEGTEITLFKAEAAAKEGVSAQDFNQAMGLYQSNSIKAEKNNKKEKVEREKAAKVDTSVSKKDLNHHKDSIKNTLEKMEKVEYLFTSKEDLANALKEKFSNKEYDALHADIEQVLKFIPEFNSKDDVKNIKKTVEKQLEMNGFQKDILDKIVKFAENAQIQKEFDEAVKLYDKAKVTYGENVNFKGAYETAKEQIKKDSYSDKVKDLLEKYAKADALEHVDALAVTNKKELEDKDLRKALKENVQKGDDFLKDAIDNKENMVEISVRRNKFEDRAPRVTSITAKEIEKELGYDLYQKLNQSFLSNNQKDSKYDLTKLVDIVRKRIGADVLVRINDDLPMSELNIIKKDLEVEINESLSDKETKKIINLLRAEIKEKDRSLKTAIKNGVDGIFPGLAGALSASRVLKMTQKMSIVCSTTESNDFLKELASQNIKPQITDLGDGNIRIEMRQSMISNPFVLNALIGAGVGFASRALATLIFGEADYERSCVSIADFDPKDPQYTNLDSYKDYLQKRLPKDKANMLISIAENCKNEKGEFDKAQFDSLMKHIAGVGSLVTCDELKGFSKGITVDKPKVEEKNNEDKKDPVKPETVVTQGVKAAKDPVYEDVPAIDGSRTGWVQIASQYDCLIKKYGLNATIRMIKIAQAINNGDYSEENIVKLYEQSKKGLANMKNIEGLDYDKYKNALLATYLPDRKFDKDGNYIKGTGVKVPDVLAGCERNKEKSLSVTKKVAIAQKVVSPNGHAADRRKVQDGVTGKFGYRVNGGEVIECKDAADLDAKVKAEAEAARGRKENVTIEKIKPWDEFTK